MGYSTVDVADIEGAGPGGAEEVAPEGMTFVAIGARRGAYEPQGPF